ncbi:MAG: hypothetical protein F6J92_41895 [Symploca sp. SIO1A3]|nr:hypothetical protein [Symploca sp. SIO1A3]
MDLDHFKKLYRYVSENWEEKLYGTTGRAPILEKYQEIPYTKSSQNAAISLDATIKLNLEPNQIRIWTDSEEFRQKLWLAACAAQQPVSLCLGLPNQAAALKGHFLNSTILDFNVDLDREHHLQQRRTSDKRSASLKVIPSRSIDVEQQRPEQRKRSNQDAEAQRDKLQAPSRQYPARGEGWSNSLPEEVISGIKGIKQLGQQVGQEFREFLRGSDPYADEDIDLDEGEQLSPQQEALENSRNRKNAKRDRVQDKSSELNKGIDVGFKPKSGQDDSKNSEDWF